MQGQDGQDDSPAKKPSTVMKHTLKARNLAKLGKMKLVDKIQKAAGENDDPENAAKDLKNLLTKEEATRAWGKHNTWLKNQSEEEQEAHKSKKEEKGRRLLFFGEEGSQKVSGMDRTMNAQTSLGQREAWTSEAKLVKEHGREEFDAHVASGRIPWRQDPWTYGVLQLLGPRGLLEGEPCAGADKLQQGSRVHG